MKVRLTEGQLEMLRLLKEGEELVAKYDSKMTEINEEINRIFNRLTFSTLAEILEGDIDVGVMKRTLESYESLMYKHSSKVSQYFMDVDEDEYFEKWDSVEIELDDKNHKITKKIDALVELIEYFEPFIGSDFSEKFKDNKPLDIK